MCGIFCHFFAEQQQTSSRRILSLLLAAFAMMSFESMSGSNLGKDNSERYPLLELDTGTRKGRVLMVREGLFGDESVFHHWAIAINFQDGLWIKIDGSKNMLGMLSPGFQKSFSAPEGDLVPMNQLAAAYDKMDYASYLVSLVTPTFWKALSTSTVKFVKVSPWELHELAGSIPPCKYLLGFNDCQTWLMDALSKLKRYEIDDKTYGEHLADTLFSPIKAVTTPVVKAVGCVGNVAYELTDTFMDVMSLKGNPAHRLVEGVGKSTEYAVTGVAGTANSVVDGVAGMVTHGVGFVTGGYAAHGGVTQNMGILSAEVKEGRMNMPEAVLAGVGRTTGVVVNGVARSTTGVVGGVSDTASGLVTDTVGTYRSSTSAIGKTYGEVSRGERNPVVGVAVGAGRVTAAVATGVGKSAVGVVSGVAGTATGLAKNLFSMF